MPWKAAAIHTKDFVRISYFSPPDPGEYSLAFRAVTQRESRSEHSCKGEEPMNRLYFPMDFFEKPVV
jgi:hypothetical protein